MTEVINTAARANPRLSFSASVPKLQTHWDSVSLGALKKCARFYQYSIIEGWQGRGFSLHLQYGILYHRAMEVYAHTILLFPDHEQALRITLRDLAEHCQVEKTNPQTGEITQEWWDPNEYLNEKQAKDNSKTLPNLFRTVVWYLDEYKDDPCKTVILADGKPATELSFRYELGFNSLLTGEAIFHSGHMDRLVEFGDAYYVMDWKTSKNTINQASSYGYFAQFSPNNQMTGYTLAGRVTLGKPAAGVIINAAQIAKGFSRFERKFVMRTDDQLAEWAHDVEWWIRQAETYVEADYWPQNDTSCSDYGGCTFRDICNKDPAVREVFLQSDFERRPWDPLQTRGDI